MAASSTNSIARELKDAIARRRGEIAAARRDGASGLDLCRALTALVDDAVGTAFSSVSAGESARHMAVVAVGGYGRAELCPHSDVDIMVLCDDTAEWPVVERDAGALLRLLWDAGLDVGHSVRRLGEVGALHGGVHDLWASLLESRYVCGERSLVGSLQQMLVPASGAPPDRWFLEGLLADASARHERYGHSVKLLEPNIKKSAGGLRDFQSLLWLLRSSGSPSAPPWDDAAPAALLLLASLPESGSVEEAEALAARSAVDFLLRTRHEMHLLRGSLHDTLEHALQREVAEGLGYGPATDPSAAEAFMRGYYRHARVIHRLHVRLMSALRDRLHPPPRAHHEGERVGEVFALHEDRLTIDPSVERIPGAGCVLEAFVHAAERGLDLDPRLCRLVEQGTGLFTDVGRSSPDLAAHFRRILRSGRVGTTLHSMNNLGVLGAYIPEFGDLVAFCQHSVYHYYTADEHTLIAVSNAERLGGEEGILPDVFRALPRRDLLYIAILLHDIGKVRGVAGHEDTGADMAAVILRRLGMETDLPAVTFLVRHHLLMEQTAFRRNIHDPSTTRDFAARIPSPELLDALYVLTYADLSAVNSTVWTSWKASLLQELYVRVSPLLRGGGEDLHGMERAARDHEMEHVEEHLTPSVAPGEVRRHIAAIPNRAYTTLFSAEEIGRHIAAGAAPSGVTTLIVDRDGFSEVTVIARDAPFLLSRCCAVLSANDANIFDAAVMTREDGVIFDRFRVTGVGTGRSLETAVHVKIIADMQAVIGGSLDVGHLFRAHRRRWRRRVRPVGRPGGRAVRIDTSEDYMIVDVYAEDSVGLLYRLTNAMSALGLDIHFAKIAMRGDGVADAFYVRDRGGRPPGDRDLQERIQRGLLEILAAVDNEELA